MGGLPQVVFGVLVLITVALVAFAIGVLITLDDLRSAVKRPRFLGLLALNAAAVPVLGYLLVQAVPLDPGIEAGVVLCAICAGGPLALKVSQLCGADLHWTLSLTVALLLLNVALVPMWSTVLLDRSLTIRAGDLFAVLFMAILLPVLAGAWVSRQFPRSSRAWSGRATEVSDATLVLAVATGVAVNARDLVSAFSAWGLFASVALVSTCAVLGWLLPLGVERRRASALVTLNRATSVALLVVGRAYLDNAEVFTAVVLFGVIQTAAAVALSMHWRRGAFGIAFGRRPRASGAD